MPRDFSIFFFGIIFFFNIIGYLQTKSLQFKEPLQRFVYDDQTDTIILASVNHLYSLNASDFSLLSDVKTNPTENDHQCPLNNNRTTSSVLYAFPSTTYLSSLSFINNTFNQYLLLANQSVLICSTSNRGGSCQLRSLIHLNLLKNSSQRVVSSSPFYPSIGLISQSNGILYTGNTFDPHCDPFYEIPTMTGRSIEKKDFLSIINLNSGQSALQQSTYTLRLLNIRLIKDFFLHYLYGFEYGQFTYFLTIQQADLHHTRTHKLQTKLIRFCQTLQQPMIKTYVEIPLTCGHSYSYLVRAKFDVESRTLFAVFRNTTLATAGNTSHAICSYSIDSISEAFFQTIKRCLVDGKGYRGLGHITSDTHCIANKNLNDINHEYCPENDDSFFQYPIGGHRALEQIEPLIQFHDQTNFTAIEIVSMNKDFLIVLGDDRGTIRTFQTSNPQEIREEKLQSPIVVDLQMIKTRPALRNAHLLILTNDQIIQQNLSVCEQYSTCDTCATIPLCHWCAKENRCAATFECTDGHLQKLKNIDGLNMCTNIQRVTPEIISLDSPMNEMEVVLNHPWNISPNQYKCQYQVDQQANHLFYTDILQSQGKSLICAPPLFVSMAKAIEDVILSIYDVKMNRTFGFYNLSVINCSNFVSCSSCTKYSHYCLWNLQNVRCQDKSAVIMHRKRWINNSDQCPRLYLQQSINRLPLQTNQTLVVHLEQCDQLNNVEFCHLNDIRKRFSFVSLDVSMTKVSNETDLCLLQCSFSFVTPSTLPTITFHRPIQLNLSVEFSNETSIVVPRAHVSLYHCERMALNCTSCLQLDPSFGCIWCNNMCMLKNQTVDQEIQCPNYRECLVPVIHSVEPIFLPINGGTIVTIKGKNFNLFNLSVTLAGISCRVIEEDSSADQIFCQSGDADESSRSGPVQLRFGSYGPVIYSTELISYLYPIIHSIQPLIGIESGGTLITIEGTNLTIGNQHLSILIGSQPCQILSMSNHKVQCETTSFLPLIPNENQPIKLYFDRQTKLVAEKSFQIVSNPIVYSFDRHSQFRSFISGGRQLVVRGENFKSVQNVRLEFKRTIFVSPLIHNDTNLIFLTPSIQELNVDEQQLNLHQPIEIILHLDFFNRTSSIIYSNDPLIYELEPMLQSYTSELTIFGANFTALGHSMNEIFVHIGCDLCPIVHLQSDKLICQPPLYRPKKYSKTNRLCYDSEHPWIIVTIDNIHSHVGYMIYPKRLIILGVLAGCLVTILLVVLIVLIIVCIRIRCNQRKSRRRYLYGTGLKHHGDEKDPYHDTLKSKTYQKLPPIEQPLNDGLISTSPSVPLRSFVAYLQHCFFYDFHEQMSSYDIPKSMLKKDIFEQFQFLINNSEEFRSTLTENLFKSNNKKLLTNLLLMQRYQLKNFLQYQNDWIDLQLCLLTAYDGFLSNQITTVLYQLYFQLKQKIQSGPIDAIEPTSSFYSLNHQTILHDQSILFHPVQLIIHIDCQTADDLILIHVVCLTCDTISQVKEKILQQLSFYQPTSRVSIDECQLYLLTNLKSNPNSCSTSSCSSSTTSSNVPIAKKSLITQFFSTRSTKYSTTTTTSTTLNDPYRDSVILLLNDFDNTNEHLNQCQKFNTLQHYGILNDGYELKLILPQINCSTPHSSHLSKTLRSNYFDCQYCSSDREKLFSYLTSIKTSSNSKMNNEEDRMKYFHLLNHTYEEIGESGHLLLDNNHSETYRLFETKSIIHSILINLIEILFNNFLHSDTYLSELIEQHPRLLHIFYGHLIPFLFKHLDCLFDQIIEPSVKSSFEILATIFHIACANGQSSERICSLCLDSKTNNETQMNLNFQNCTLLFADEIQRVRLHFSNVERRLNNKTFSSEYSSTNTGINRVFEMDPSIVQSLVEFVCLHSDQIVENLKIRLTDEKIFVQYENLIQNYRSSTSGRT